MTLLSAPIIIAIGQTALAGTSALDRNHGKGRRTCTAEAYNPERIKIGKPISTK